MPSFVLIEEGKSLMCDLTHRQLFQEEKSLALQLDLVEKKNRLLTDIIDTDYLEILYRKKFMVGKSNEHIYKNN